MVIVLISEESSERAGSDAASMALSRILASILHMSTEEISTPLIWPEALRVRPRAEAFCFFSAMMASAMVSPVWALTSVLLRFSPSSSR